MITDNNQFNKDSEEKDILEETREIDPVNESLKEESLDIKNVIIDEYQYSKKQKKYFLAYTITLILSVIIYYICKAFDPLKGIEEIEVQSSRIIGLTKYIMIISIGVSIVCLFLIIFYFVNIKLIKAKTLDKVNELFEWFIIFPICIMITSICFSFIFTFTVVEGDSMVPNLISGEELFLKYNTEIDRFDIVVIHVKPTYDKVYTDSLYVKRIIGLPGERIEYRLEGNITKLYVNGEYVKETFYTNEELEEYQTILNFDNVCRINFSEEELVYNGSQLVIPDGYYLVLGDNRTHSRDSRTIGLIKEEDIIGEIKYRVKNLFSYESIEKVK